MTTLTSWLTIINLVLLIATTIGGFFAIRSTISKVERDVQTRVLDALTKENELLQSQKQRLEKEVKRLNTLIELIIAMLKKTHKIELEVDGESLFIRGATGNHHARIDPSNLTP